MARWVYSAFVAGWVTATGLILWLVAHVASRDAAAFLGVIAILVAAVSFIVWHETAVLKLPLVPEENDPQWLTISRARDKRWYWPANALLNLLPGLWIGVMARSPWLAAAAYLLGGKVVGRLIEALPSRLPPDPVRRRLGLAAVAMLLGGTLVGIGLRVLSHR